MKLELIREKTKIFPLIGNPLDYSEIRIWHCKYQSFTPISDFQNAENIEIATFPDSSLDCMGNYQK
jgi:hypothetical protein